MRHWRFFIAFLLSAISLAAFASGRPFPASTKRGTMTPDFFPKIVIDGQARRLAPGARIWNTKNLIVVPSSVRGSDLTVNYTEDMHGDINRVWILSPEEASEPLAKQTTSPIR